jgi:hypothetical protein
VKQEGEGVRQAESETKKRLVRRYVPPRAVPGVCQQIKTPDLCYNEDLKKIPDIGIATVPCTCCQSLSPYANANPTPMQCNANTTASARSTSPTLLPLQPGLVRARWRTHLTRLARCIHPHQRSPRPRRRRDIAGTRPLLLLLGRAPVRITRP